MLPVIPTVSGSNRRRQAAATAWSASSGRATRMTLTSPSAAGQRTGPADEERGGAGLDRGGEVLVAVGPLAGQRDEQVARLDPARVDRRAADRAGEEARSSRPPVSRAISAPSKASPGGRGSDGGGASVTAASVP